MNVNLGRTFDRFVEKMLQTGLYQSHSEIVREALRLLKEREDMKQFRLAELRSEIAIGTKQADSGALVDGEAAFARILRRGRKQRHARG